MNLRDSIRVLRKRWPILVAIVVICLAAGTALTLLSTEKYEATAQIFVSTSGADTTQALAQGNTFTQARVQSYTSLANSPEVTTVVIRDLGLTISASDLRDEITADAPLNKVLINVNVTDRSAAQSARLANAVAETFSDYVEKLETPPGSSEASPVTLNVTQPATVPTGPVTPKAAINLAVAFVAGVLLGLAAVALRELLDNTVKSPEELTKQAGAPVLSVVPFDKRIGNSPLAFRADSHGMRAEAFRQLRTNLQFVDVDRPPRVIAVTSALPGEGKTHAALNLAAALAEAGHRVCLVEADLRRPTIAKLLGLVSNVGLTSVLIGATAMEDVLQNAGRNLAVLTSGQIPPNPSELLVSDQCQRTLQDIGNRVDLVVIDTAPLLPVADGAEMSALADATLLVVRAGKTTKDQVRRATETLTKVGVTPVGTVLSMASGRRSGGYDYYYSDYRPRNRRGGPDVDVEVPARGLQGPDDDVTEPVDEDVVVETGTRSS